MKIEIHIDDNSAWCFVNGSYIFGKNKEELEECLKTMSDKGLLINEKYIFDN